MPVITLSEGKRTADAVEGFDRPDVKKPRLANDGEPSTAQNADVEQTEDAEEELPEDATDEPVTSMDVDQTATASEPAATSEPRIRFKKGKTAEGASAHFKENPYTFIAPDDPIIKACVYVRCECDAFQVAACSSLLTRHCCPATTLISARTFHRQTCWCGTQRATRSARYTW